MDFSLSEQQRQVKALVRDFCRREVDQKRIAEILRKNDAAKTIEEIRDNFPHDLVEKAHKTGLRTIGIPTKYGGPGPDTDVNMTIAIANEEAGYSAGSAASLVLSFSHGEYTNPYVTEEEKKALFSGLLQYSRKLGCMTLTEPSGGIDIEFPYDEGGNQILKVTARKDGDDWIINGDKMWSGGGAVADVIRVFARTKEGPISESASWFLVPVNTPGVTRTLNKLLYTGLGGNCQYNYDNVRVPQSALQGELHTGWKQIAHRNYYMWQLFGPYVGQMQRIYEHMRDYAKQRIGGGKPIIQYGNIAVKLGDLAMHLEALRALMYRVAYETDQLEQSETPPLPQGNWYWFATFLAYHRQVAWQLCEVAHNIYGSMASSEDMPVESFMRDIFHIRAGLATNDVFLIKTSMDYDDRLHYETHK